MGLTGKLIGWIRLGPLSCLLVRLFGSPEAKRRLKNLDALPEAIGMRPEVELINYHVMALAGIRNLANASAFMALTWSTVVLHGGFITSLRIQEFWFLTVMSFIMGSGFLNLVDSGKGKIYKADLNLAIGWVEMKRHGKVASSSIVWRFMEFLISFHRPTVLMSKYAMMIMKFLLLLVLSIIIGYAPIGCIILSAMRLLSMDYGDADGTAANKTKLRAALSIFYCLVLLQSLLFYYFLSISLDRHDRIITVSDMCGLEDYGPKLIQRYYEDTKVQCDKDSDLPDDWNLMKFAVGLLEFGSRDDYLSGVRVLDTFVMKKIDFRMVLLSKRRSLQNLIMLLGWNHQGKREIRERAARIVAYLATDLHISQFPGALQSISSLLETSEQYYDPAVVHLPENSERGLDREGHHLRSRSPEQSEHQDLRLPVVNVDQQGNQQDVNLSSSGRLKYRVDKQTTWKNRVMRLSSTYLPKFKDIKEAWHKRTTNQRTKDRLFGDEDCYSFESKGSKELVFQGLVILEKLTENQGNCIEICRDEGLPKMITESLNFPTLLRAGCDHTLMQTLIRSLRLLSRLITAPGNDSARLRHGVSCNREAISNLVRVLEYQVEGVQELQEQALEIVSAITFDVTKSMAIVFGRIVHHIFLPCTGHDVAFVVAEQENLRAIRLRRRAGEVLARLLSILSESDRTIIPEMLRERGSTDFLNANKDIMNLLTKVLSEILSKEIETGNAETRVSAIDNSVAQNRTQSSDQQNEEQSEGRKLLATMLCLTVVICKKLIDKDDFTRVALDDAALIRKLTEILEKNNSATPDCLGVAKFTCQLVIVMVQFKPSCIEHINEHSFEEVLAKALKTMRDLDYCMLFAGSNHEMMMHATSLAYLVEEAQELFATAQQSLANINHS